MSKNRPRHRPSHSPSATERRKHEKPQPWLSKTRNKLLALGLVGTAAAIGFFRSDLTDLFKGKTPAAPVSTPTLPPQQVSEPLLSEAHRIQKPTEYREWADKIELPHTSISPLNEAVEAPPAVLKPDKYAALLRRHKQELSVIDEKMKKTSGLMERDRIIFDYFSAIGQEYLLANNQTASPQLVAGTASFYKFINEINSGLIPVAHLRVEYDHLHHIRLAIFRPKGFGEVRVKMASNSFTIPYALFEGQADYLSDPQAEPLGFSGIYEPKAGCIFMNVKHADRKRKNVVFAYEEQLKKTGTAPQIFDDRKVGPDLINSGFYHEAMHAYFYRLGIAHEPGVKSALRGKGDVSMGSYTIDREQLNIYNNAQLHELAAHGYGLMKSGSSARLAAYAISLSVDPESSPIENYLMARDVIWYELVNSPEMDPKIRRKIERIINQEHKMSMDLLTAGLSRFSEPELHRIGERMAKLAIYLIQEE